jgi:hypothetical protein
LLLTVHISEEPPLVQPKLEHVVVVMGQELLHVPELQLSIPFRHVWHADVRSPVQLFWHPVSPAGQAQKHWKNAAQSAVTHAPLQLSTVHCQHPVLICAEVHDGPVNGNAPELEPLPLELPVPPSPPMFAVRPPHAKNARKATTAAGTTSEPLLMPGRSLPPNGQGHAMSAACSAAWQPAAEHEVQSKTWPPSWYQACVQAPPSPLSISQYSKD